MVLQARPPANGLARSLADAVVDHTAAQVIAFDVSVGDRPPVADAALRLSDGRWLTGRVGPLVRDELRLRTLERARSWGLLWLSLIVAAYLASLWGRGITLAPRLAGVAVALAAVAVVPLNALSNVSPLFDPTYYYAPLGGAFTATIGALGLTSALLLLGLLSVVRARQARPPRLAAALLVLAVVVLGPLLLRQLGRGITMPPTGVPSELWLAWQVALALAGTAILLAGASAGRALLGSGRGLPLTVAPALAVLAALFAQPLWHAPAGWPPWYPIPWALAIAALALARRSRALVLSAATIAALGAMTLVWGGTVRRRVALAERDVAGLTRVDPVVQTLLERFATDLGAMGSVRSRAGLLAEYAASDLAAAEYAVQLAAWNPAGEEVAQLSDVTGGGVSSPLAAAVAEARHSGRAMILPAPAPVGLRLALVVPHADGWVTSVAVAARTRLFAENPYAPLLLGAPPPVADPPYTLTLGVAAASSDSLGGEPQWVRRSDLLHGDWLELLDGRPVRVHVEVELRSIGALAARGALLLLLDLTLVGVLWALTVVVEPGFPRWLRARRREWSRSYRSRLSLALFGFFAIPAVVFGVWASQQLQSDARQARELLVGEALRVAAPDAAELTGEAVDPMTALARHGGDVPLLLYRDGILTASSDELITALAPLGRLLPPDVAQTIGYGAHTAAARERTVGSAHVLVGFRALASGHDRRLRPVLAVPARSDEVTLGRRRRDLGVLVSLAIAGGALAALWLSGVAARQLARPIGTLREGALAIAAGEREPPLTGPPPPAEFQPVFSAFRRMAADLGASRTALEEAERRIAAVLRQVASAVIAVDATGMVTLYNPAAALLFGRLLRPGVPLADLGVPELEQRLSPRGRGAAESGGEDVVELTLGSRQIHARLTPLQVGGGAVLTLDDVTELARAQRVLAWGEMARQVAHEIKNPLTPIRLGVQHLRRAYGARRDDFEQVLTQNVERILSEIDRLDEIARAFSRYGTAPERQGGEPVDVALVVRDVVELERLGATDGAGVRWRIEGAEASCMAIARSDELREVLLNLLENARLANAREVLVQLDAADGVQLRVIDDGDGIPPDVQSRIFEPHFSTRTSGSGLGLAISRRLVESWGGRIGVASAAGRGTTVEITLAASAS